VLLLDTCALLWLAGGGESLSVAAREAIADPDARLFVSAITAFELGVKHRRGALKLPLPPFTWYDRALDFHQVQEIPIDGRIAASSTALPRLHADPCDRIIVATAQRDGLAIVTPDPLIRGYPKTLSVW
jgi:PIN domain nuclease of toxin-antitoxin system